LLGIAIACSQQIGKFMIKCLRPLLCLFFLTGCVSHIPLSEQAPALSYASKEPLVIGVIDSRKRVKAGKPRTFIGVAHGVFGIPSDCEVDPWIAVEEGDDKKDLAQFLQKRIVTGLSNKGWKVSEIDVETVPNLNQAEALLTKYKTKHLLVLQLNEWFFSINLNLVTAFNFDTDTDVIIFSKEKGQVLTKKFAGRDVVDVKGNDSYQNQILMAYREQLNEIFNNPEIQKSLQDY
jgi:hypothetical protein